MSFLTADKKTLDQLTRSFYNELVKLKSEIEGKGDLSEEKRLGMALTADLFDRIVKAYKQNAD